MDTSDFANRLAASVAEAVAPVDGVVAVALGGSRARGTATESSDIDLGLYYRGALDTEALGAVCRQLAGAGAEVTDPGEWGPWVDGGGWLNVEGADVDLIYRDLDRVDAVWQDCQRGEVTNQRQPGHPLGFFSHVYAGEVAWCRPLAGDVAALADRKAVMQTMPSALADALVAWLWEADFSLFCAGKAIDRRDTAYIAGSMFRAIGILCQSMHGYERQWLLNEKGAVQAGALLPCAPDAFADRVDQSFGALGRGELSAAMGTMADLVHEVRNSVSGPLGAG